MSGPSSRIKNKNPAPIQLSAEQLLREAVERQENVTRAPRQRITDQDELLEYRQRKRAVFENAVKIDRHEVYNWIRYATFEEGQGEFERARSLFERGLAVDSRSQVLWQRYIEFEMKNKFINHARNVFDRAITIHPRVDAFWYKWVYMEERLANIAGARQVFERWMEWQPTTDAWESYIKLEVRYKQLSRARVLWERYVECHPEPKVWLKFAKFEEEQGEIERTRTVFNTSIEYLGEDADVSLFIGWALFEARLREHERARAIFVNALNRFPNSLPLATAYSAYERQHGSRTVLENVLLTERRSTYETSVTDSPLDYDNWFDYIRLEEQNGTTDTTREIYERAIANVPPIAEKKHWRRYLYLWLGYALYEELQGAEDRAREVYKACIGILPKAWSSAKIWLNYARFELRRSDVATMRKMLGRGLGQGKKERIYKGYIELELELREFDRCRILYQQYIKNFPSSSSAWLSFADLEKQLGDVDRARAIYTLAISMEDLDLPEVVWKGYIDFEVDEGEYENVRKVYETLVERSLGKARVWVSWALCELKMGGAEASRQVFTKAESAVRQGADVQERVMLMEAWKEFETSHGTDESRQAIAEKMPRPVKKRRRVEDTANTNIQWEEYIDYLFPTDEAAAPNLKLLEAARKWKEANDELKRKREAEQTE